MSLSHTKLYTRIWGTYLPAGIAKFHLSSLTFRKVVRPRNLNVFKMLFRVVRCPSPALLFLLSSAFETW